MENLENNLQNMIRTCVLQATWHHEQYLRLQYCERYFAYLLQYREHYDEHYIENLVRNLNMRSNVNDTDSQTEFVNTENSDDNILTDTQSPARKKKKKRKKKSKVKPVAENVEIKNESGLELDDGFKNFLKESAKFRAERDIKKNQLTSLKAGMGVEEENIEVEYVDILRKGPDGTILPPTAHNRKKLYEEKYGECGTTILSLETALQWKFNKFTDTTSPTVWPSLPLRLIYDE